MNSFDTNPQVEDFEICDYYNELQEVLLEMVKDDYKNSLNYFTKQEV